MAKAIEAAGDAYLLDCGHEVGAVFDGQKIRVGSRVDCRSCAFHAGAKASAARRRAAAEAAAKAAKADDAP